MTELEERLRSYAEQSSRTERDKQQRAVRMVQQALDAAESLRNIELELRPKGSYPNATNVRLDSDVDIAVIQKRCYIVDYDGERSDLRGSFGYGRSPRYTGSDFRAEIENAARKRFKNSCGCTGNTAITVAETSARVSADIVPSFHYRRIISGFPMDERVDGLTTLRRDGTWIVNYPDQQLQKGRSKNIWTLGYYKQLVRILKRVENELVDAGMIDSLASYFVECLMFNVPNSEIGYFLFSPLTRNLRSALNYIVAATEDGTAAQWVEANGIKPLFGPGQPWDIRSANELAVLAQKHLGLA